MRHVHAEHPDQVVALALVQFAERVEEALHAVVVLRVAALVKAAGERPAQDRQNLHVGPEHVLEEDHLELDRVLEGEAVVLHRHRRASAVGEPVDQRRGRRAPRPAAS